MKKIFQYKIIYFILLIIYSCNNEKIIITYTDGNGNIYILNNTYNKTLEYKPIKPQMSSSGTYNGGKYSKVTINNKQYNEIKSFIYKAINKKSILIKNKIKKSGVISIQKNKIKKIYILKPETEEQFNIEIILKKIIKK